MATIDRRRFLRSAATVVAAAAAGRGAFATPAAHAAQHPPAQGGRPPKELGEAVSLDGRPLPAIDTSRANKLPREMIGYWERSFDVGSGTRTAKIYISPETPIRAYYTVIAVPDGVDTDEFLRKSSWREIADQREEGLFILEPGPGGWGSAAQEADYVAAAMSFHQSNNYFSIFGMHYLVGYGAGAPALEAWAVANPLRVISQVYLESAGLRDEYLRSYADLEFDGSTPPPYTNVEFPEGFDLIRYDEVVLPTWYIDPDRSSVGASLSYWKQANDTVDAGTSDRTLGTVFEQRPDSDRWMTTYEGPIAQVAVSHRPVSYWNKRTTDQIVDFLTFYTRYDNTFAYGNELYRRADFGLLGVERRTMTVEGFLREYLVYVPKSAGRLWGDAAPVVFVWPGNTQTAKLFFDAPPWWQVADREGCILVVIGEHYSSAVSVTHRDSLPFFRQLRDVMTSEYPVDPTRFYSTGQSLGSRVTQEFAVALPGYFAAVASTSFTTAPNAQGNVSIDGVVLPASHEMIPNYQIYGYGDLGFLRGTLWDDTQNSLDTWAAYFLGVNDLELDDVDDVNGVRSGWHDRFQTWTWYDSDGGEIPVFKVSKNLYRAHNTIPEEAPLLWDFLEHYRREVQPDGSVVRYYSESGFRVPGDSVQI